MINEKNSTKKVLQGKVVSNKMINTVVVAVDTKQPHPLYSKIVTSRKKYKAHTEDKFEIDDIVKIQEHKPISKDKRWIVIEKVSK